MNTAGGTNTHTVIDSPIGPLTLVATDGVLSGLYMENHTPAPDPANFGERSDAGFATTVEQLAEYFDGRRTEFTIATAAHGNDFQHRVWALMSAIPYGRTSTYGQVAAQLGRTSLARAVGGASARNPLSIIVPCHRMIGAGGSLTGYAGGVGRKRFLLDLESRRDGRPAPAGR